MFHHITVSHHKDKGLIQTNKLHERDDKRMSLTTYMHAGKSFHLRGLNADNIAHSCLSGRTCLGNFQQACSAVCQGGGQHFRYRSISF